MEEEEIGMVEEEEGIKIVINEIEIEIRGKNKKTRPSKIENS